MTVKEVIENKLKGELSPSFLEVANESHMHNVPKGSETHFKVTVATERFSGKSLVDRHREIYRLLGDELRGGVHALSLHTYTPEEWSRVAPLASPKCLGEK